MAFFVAHAAARVVFFIAVSVVVKWEFGGPVWLLWFGGVCRGRDLRSEILVFQR